MTSDTDDINVLCVPIDAPLLRELAQLYVDEPYKQSLWEWQFKPRFGRNCMAIIARHHGRLIGFNATMPVQVWNGHSAQEAVWSCDFIVAKEFRGKGVGNAIKAKMLQTFTTPIMSLGISNDALPILVKKGWVQGPLVPVHKRIFRARNLRECVLFILSQYAQLLAIRREPREYCHQFFQNNNLPEAFILEQLKNSEYEAQHVGILKDQEYLQWRYVEFPWPIYSSLLILSETSKPLALLIYRYISNVELEVTDYLAATYSHQIVHHAIELLHKRYPQLVAIVWSCSHKQLQESLVGSGLLKKTYGTRFVCFDPNKCLADRPWSLAAGDSDGDFLKVVKKFSDRDSAETHLHAGLPKYRLVRISEQEFLSSQQPWDELIANTDANPLFMSWHWQSTWWRIWGKKLNLELFIHFIFSGHELVGILPLYRYQRRRWNAMQIQFLGNAWRIAPTVRSEYIGPIFSDKHGESLLKYFDRWLSRLSFRTTVIVPDCVMGRIGDVGRSVVRQSDTGYRVDTQGSLDEYVASLGAQTRLKAFNRLSYLEQRYPEFKWEEVPLTPTAVDDFFDVLNRFHERRWKKPCFDEHAVRFHKNLIFSDSKFRPFLHRLEIDGDVVSVSYNLACGKTLYNIQSGYLEGYDKKLSLGTLHFGKLLSHCFHDPTIDALDFLAGAGKNSDYKNHFRGQKIRFSTYQFFSSRSYRAVHNARKMFKILMSKKSA